MNFILSGYDYMHSLRNTDIYIHSLHIHIYMHICSEMYIHICKYIFTSILIRSLMEMLLNIFSKHRTRIKNFQVIKNLLEEAQYLI